MLESDMDILRGIIEDHFSRYPAMRAQDLYKLLHQAAMGNEHIGTDQAAIMEWFERELTGLQAGPSEPMIDPISPDTGIARIHLRPWIFSGRSPGLLLTAFLRTVKEWSPQEETLEWYGKTAVDLAVMKRIPLQEVEISSVFATMKAQGFPSIHHSPEYQEHYHPAYRVVHLSFLEEA